MLKGSNLWTFLFLLFCRDVCGNGKALENAIEEVGDDTDVSALYQLARKWYEVDTTNGDGIELFRHLSDSKNHVLSSAKLGHHYVSVNDLQAAIKYFARAGENGPHHASLYNAGRLLVELGDWVGALAYLRAAATLSQSYPKEYISNDTTESAKEAYNVVSRRISREELTIVQAADIFLHGSLDNIPDEAEVLWRKAVTVLVKFNQTFVETNGKTQDENAMRDASQALRSLWEKFGITGSFSDLQSYILLLNINDMLGPLAALYDDYVPMAAGYAEALATHSLYCWDHFAVIEDDSACFNGAAASAMSFYRRAADGESAKRVLHAAQQHPQAATHWKLMEQTPRVFHPNLTARPWWTATDFSAARALSTTFQTYSTKIIEELQAVKSLEDGRRRSASNEPQYMELDASGNMQVVSDMPDGFQRKFIPHIGVRTEETGSPESGAGGWAEFGPLFDGISWNQRKCEVVPTICEALKEDGSLCSARTTPDSTNNVWQLCGTGTVVTILRLRPGTTMLPHCGTTNSRLIMHFPLEGAEGIEFTVGGKVYTNYDGGDGHAVVFDDSFENSVHHGGKKDSFVVLAVLAHPDLL